MNSIKKTLSLIFILFLAGCNHLDVQDNYCEIAFAYPAGEELPEVLDKALIGCACTSKDILRGIETAEWQLFPLEKCRRVRGFPPEQWKKVIDPYFQMESTSKKIEKIARRKGKK